jgi:hypothetical protein
MATQPRQPVLTVSMTAPQVLGALALFAVGSVIVGAVVARWWIVSDSLVLERDGWQCSEAARARPTEPRAIAGPGWSLEWLTPEQAQRCVVWRRSHG